MQAKLKTQPNRNNELWIGLSSNKRLSVTSNRDFMIAAGIEIKDKIERIDNFVLNNPTLPVTVRAFDLKSPMAIEMLAKGSLDCAIMGRDTVKEFNLFSRGKPPLMQASELLGMGIARCAFTIATKCNDVATKPADLNGRDVVTQYPQLLNSWAKQNNMQFGRVFSGERITGGIEGFDNFEPSVTVIADLVESGRSMVVNGWRPLGIRACDWDDVTQGATKFIDLPPQRFNRISGIGLQSSAVFVRNPERLSDLKEDTINALIWRFEQGAKAMGGTPRIR